MTIHSKTFDNGARSPESTAAELNRIVGQAEELLKSHVRCQPSYSRTG